jgi:iron complex outermembrane receptor protein
LKSATLRFTAGVQNVLTLTKYNGLDPEKFNGIDNNVYPRARTFLFEECQFLISILKNKFLK